MDGCSPAIGVFGFIGRLLQLAEVEDCRFVVETQLAEEDHDFEGVGAGNVRPKLEWLRHDVLSSK